MSKLCITVAFTLFLVLNLQRMEVSVHIYIYNKVEVEPELDVGYLANVWHDVFLNFNLKAVHICLVYL